MPSVLAAGVAPVAVGSTRAGAEEPARGGARALLAASEEEA
eukprot:CAMPEP_0171263090 /NCGR_PEP_ID=MMETSP0790-20130122/56911_1 /TAXON_ID=2925 /ORGANISM="Alexandrium catenella, Strain OF101" /LENGTH=40 /DNA_ID= /DNA_START= /DNA_END= /DNA_ORIENTATION=